MRLTIGSSLLVEDAPPAVAARLRALATFPNPKVLDAERFHRDTYGIEPETTLYEEVGNLLILPRGLLDQIRPMVNGCTVHDLRLALPPVRFRWRGELRPEQNQAAKALHDAEQGILVGPPGSGKTEMALAAVKAWSQPTIFIAHQTELLNQARDRAGPRLGLEPGVAGMVLEGRRTVGSHITFATVQSLAQMSDLEVFASQFGAVVLDGAHHAPAETFMRVLQAFPAKYRVGVTATPERRDGLGPAMLAVLGPVCTRQARAQAPGRQPRCS